MYLQTLVKRSDEELTSRVFTAMKSDPKPGDWCEMVQKDFENINLHINEIHIKQMDKSEWKKLINEKVRTMQFETLKRMQQEHTKVKHIEYAHFNSPQEYLQGNSFNNEECSLMFNLRCRTVEGIKGNFQGMFGGDQKCELCLMSIDTQEHVMQCPVLEDHIRWDHTIQYDYVYGNKEQQKLVVSIFSTLLAAREELLEKRRPTGALNTGPNIILL